MKHTYQIHGMSCNGCRSHVENTLSKVAGVKHVDVDLEKGEATLEMESHIPLETFQEAMARDGSYRISLPGEHGHGGHEHGHHGPAGQAPQGSGTGVFYCPMQCEGDRTYDAPGDCPVCGMDLVEEQNLTSMSPGQWTCPMHPEVVLDGPGACPICGMDLLPLKPSLSAE